MAEDETATALVDNGGLTAGYVPMGDQEARGIARSLFGLDATVDRLATEKDDTYRLTVDGAARAVMKVANPNDDPGELDFVRKLHQHVVDVDPSLPVPRFLPSTEGEFAPVIVDGAGQAREVHLIEWLPGTTLDRMRTSAREREIVGEALAKMRHATATFSHPFANRPLAWDARRALDLLPLLEHVADPERRSSLAAALERFGGISEEVAGLRAHVLHNDFSKSNLLGDHGRSGFLTGVFDFGDSVTTAIAVDVSTALLNQLPRDLAEHPVDDIFADGKDLLRGYLRRAELTDQELRLIPHLVMARVAARALITTHRAALFPENVEYIMRNTEQGWAQLDWFLSRPFDEVSETLDAFRSEPVLPSAKETAMTATPRGKMNNAFDPSRADGLDANTRTMIDDRARLLGPAYRLFYQDPVQVSRGKGVLLWDRDGNEYLDAYNNVVSVGHAHPAVTEAVNRQMGTLCTHTRYLQDGILAYASDLLGTFDGELGATGHTMFTCTGSEANDLALRIARHRTGHSGVIVTSEAYHGNSYLSAGFSPSLGEHSPLGAYVRRVITPDSYRLPQEELIERFIADLQAQILDIQRHGEGLAAFVADSLFTSDGIFSEPTGLLQRVAEVVHAAGGLMVADEVQCGFARSGDRFWGFQRHGIDPDIVTLGKPMGNGYPVAGVVVRHDVVESFGHDTRYFNTFGGNTVAMAAAQATFDVIATEGLQENTRRVGALLRAGLQELAARHEAIGDVRGTGLYYGVEIVADRDVKSPDATRATAIVNGLRERRVLISATGAASNVLKIRPPLVFGEEHATRLLGELDAVLAAV